MPAAPIPVTQTYNGAAPSVATVIQQYMDQYQVSFLQNQRAYNNTISNVTAANPDYQLKRAVIMARAVDAYCDPIPFGALMARSERESGFKYDVIEGKTCKDKKTGEVIWRYASPKGSKPPFVQGVSDGQYGVGPWGITAAWDSGGSNYGCTRAQALDPMTSTAAAVKTLMPVHRFIMKYVPAAKNDLVFYTWLLSAAHAGGPGRMGAAGEYIDEYKAGRPITGKAAAWMDGKAGNGLGGAVARAFRKYKQVTLNGIAEDARIRSFAYTAEEGALRLLVAGLRAPIWQSRRQKLIAGDIRGMNSSNLLAQVLQTSKSTGQSIALEGIKARVDGNSRADTEANKTRGEHFEGAARAGVSNRDHTGRSAAAAGQLAQKADLTNLQGISGGMDYDEANNVWGLRGKV